MKGKKGRNLFAEVAQTLPAFLKLAKDNNEFLLFWLVGVLLHVIAVNTLNSWAWAAIGAMDLIVGLVAIRSATLPVERALTLPGLTFSPEFGTPRWIIHGRYPCLTDKIHFTAAGIPADKYHERVAEIATRMNLPVKRIKEPKPGAQRLVAHIVRERLPDRLDFADLDLAKLPAGKFILGRSETEFRYTLLEKAIHFLVAGQTGSGKTVFIQQLALQILSLNKASRAVIIDMKGGIDFHELKNLKTCNVVTSVEDAHQVLTRIWTLHLLREKHLVLCGKRNWYQLTPDSLRREKKLEGLPIGPVLVILDELAEITGYRKGEDLKEKIHFQISEMSRLSRATGIHLILGTQRPDRTVIDGQININMVSRICFSVPSIAASSVVLNDKSAYTIGGHAGRAVCADCNGRGIIQTPYLRDEDMAPIVKEINERYSRDFHGRSILNAPAGTGEIAQVRR